MFRTFPASGTTRQRRRREVAGPYRSQSSVPAIRRQAAPAEHRSLPVSPPRQPSLQSLRSLLKAPPTPEQALQMAALHGVEPPVSARTFWGPNGHQIYDKIAAVARRKLAGQENLKQPEDLTNLIVGATGVGDVATLLRGVGTVGAKEIAAQGAKQVAGSAESKSLLRALTGTVEKGVAKRAAVRGAVKRTVARAEPDFATALRQRAVRGAERLPAPVRIGGKVAARTAAVPVRHPFTAPLAAQVPAAALHGNPAEFQKALEGKGTFADVSGSVAGALGSIAPGGKLAKQLVEEGINLPAVALPTVYLTGKAGAEAATGNSSDLKKLWAEYKKTGLLPALASGNGSAALKALENRPLYSALEASGAVAAAGRGAGAITRAATHGRVGGLARPDLVVPGYPNLRYQRGYSRDLIRQGIQRLHDRRTGSVINLEKRSGRRKLEKISKEAADRFQSNQEAVRRLHRTAALQTVADLLPKRKVLGINRLDRASANVVSHAIERIVQHPETFLQDLADYKQRLETAAKEVGPDGKPRLDKAQLKANQEMVQQLDAGLKRATPEHVVEAANAFIAAHQPIVQELVDRGILAPEQAAKAAAIPFARVHMGAGYKEGIGVVDRQGNPLSLEQITAEMQRRNIEPAGFLSHRPASNSDFYQPWGMERGNIPRAARTGESAATGSHAAGIDAVVRQMVRSHGLLDRVRSFDQFITRFGVDLRGAGVKSMADAHRVMRDPARYGLAPNVDWVPVRRHPFLSMKREIEGALEHQDPTIATEGFLAKALDMATSDAGPDGPIVFMPRSIVNQIGEHFKPTGAGMQRLQTATTAFKRAVLPFSPSFYYGNAIDNMIRTALAGITPAHFLIGRNVAKQLTPEERAQVISGNFYASVERLAAHRTTESLFRGERAFEAGMRGAAEWVRKRGVPQYAVKALPKAVVAASHGLMGLNSIITETLPQYGALGKIALADFKDTQGSWVKALTHQRQLAEEFAKGVHNPDTVIRLQKQIEEVYGNWTRMSPTARKFWSNVAPFWTWMRAAYKFVYLTMPAHHPIQTALITTAARMTQAERESLGLDKIGKEPLPNWLQGGLPIKGGIAPWAKYQSFGFAGAPVEGAARTVLSQLSSISESLRGRNWKGEAIGGGELGNVRAALGSFAESFIPGVNLLKGLSSKGPEYVNPLRAYPRSTTDYLRQPKKQIMVPEGGSGGGGGAPWRSGGSSSTGTAPWK